MGNALYSWIILLVLMVSCQSKQETKNKELVLINNPATLEGYDSLSVPIFNLEENFYSFGELVQGEVVKHIFTVENTGNAPLIVTDARASCGCTVPEYPKDPILPGQKGKIKIKFDSQGKLGSFRKQVSLFTNCQPSQRIITITGNIIKP